jgi:hypothetical protein
MSVAELAEFRRPDGRFASGRSGNPAGRPKGSRNRATQLAEALVEERAEPLLAKMIEVAEAGDAGLLRLFFKAIISPARDACVELDVAPGKELDFEEVFRVTARALFDGEITPDQALRIARFISLSVRMQELKSRESYREAKLRLEAQKQDTPPVKRQYFSREKAPAAPAAAEGGGGGLSPQPGPVPSSQIGGRSCFEPVFFVAGTDPACFRPVFFAAPRLDRARRLHGGRRRIAREGGHGLEAGPSKNRRKSVSAEWPPISTSTS